MCNSMINEESYDNKNAMNKIQEYEKSGMWSHAAELADKHSEKTEDSGLKLRALDNYKKVAETRAKEKIEEKNKKDNEETLKIQAVNDQRKRKLKLMKMKEEEELNNHA